MSDQIQPIMQAAERLRQLDASGDRIIIEAYELYGPDMTIEGYRMDVLKLAKFALSILPKGKRPVAMEVPDCKERNKVQGFVPAVGESGDVYDMDCVCPYCRSLVGLSTGNSAYRTEDDARLARLWMMVDELLAADR